MRRFISLLVFISILLALVAAGHFYLIRRLIIDTGMPEPWQMLLTGLIAALGSLMVAQPFAERMLPRPLARWVSWPAFIWMGSGFLMVSAMLVTDALFWVGGIMTPVMAMTPVSGFNPQVLQASAVVILTTLVSAGALRQALRPPVLNRVTLKLSRWPAGLRGFKILQLSDIHLGPLLGEVYARTLVELCHRENPDLIVITGDAVDGTVARIGHEILPLRDLRARHGVYYVTGNHEHYYHAREWCRAFEAIGIRVMRNEHCLISASSGSFVLAGVYDHRGNMGDGLAENLDQALANRQVPPECPVILLAHDPATFAAAVRHGVDLQLSGHTHGGQIWPFNFVVRLTTPYLHGQHHLGDSTLWVSRGTGFWGPPMRLRAPHEISVLTLTELPLRDRNAGTAPG